MTDDMNEVHLESGTLTEFEPLGAGGQAVFRRASELRATIARRLGSPVAAYFARPQLNGHGDSLDWYASGSGPVTPWARLSDEQRTAARECIDMVLKQVADLSRRLVGEGPSDQQGFARLLEQVIRYPDDSHIFLVGRQPVMTFWGFRGRGKDSDTTVPIGAQLIGRGNDARKTTEFVPASPDDHRWLGVSRRTWWWLAPALLALALITGILSWFWQTKPPAPDAAPELTPPRPPEVTAEPPAEPLVFPPEAIATHSIGFLTGRWQASGEELVDSDSRHPIALAYTLDQGVGEVTITEQSGTVCRAPVDAAFDGETLTLAPREEIRCPNRASFYGATVTCRPSTDRRALCTGSFPNGKTFSVGLGRAQSK